MATKFKKGDRVQCWGYGSHSTHLHNGCLGFIEAIEEERGCIPTKKADKLIVVKLDNFIGDGFESFHHKQLVLVKTGKKK